MGQDQVDQERREFLKQIAALGLLAGTAPLWVLPKELWAMAPKDAVPQPILAKAEGTNWGQLAGDAVQKLGGMKKFVNPGEVVVVKPNMAWDRAPELGANSHPAVVRKVVELCLEAGAKKVKVIERPALSSRNAFEYSGIKAAVEGIRDSRVTVEYTDDRRFIDLTLDRFKGFKGYSFYKDIMEADRFINIPVVKTHSRTGVTACLKNMIGPTGGFRPNLHPKIDDAIADLNLVYRPDLHVVDATRIMVKNGPTGGREDDVVVKNLVFAGTDPVALDAIGTTLFGLKPADIGHIVKAHQAGRGEMDLAKIKFL
jgi:uncharacterized protein (DUF362 family)